MFYHVKEKGCWTECSQKSIQVNQGVLDRSVFNKGVECSDLVLKDKKGQTKRKQDYCVEDSSQGDEMGERIQLYVNEDQLDDSRNKDQKNGITFKTSCEFAKEQKEIHQQVCCIFNLIRATNAANNILDLP